MSSLRRLMGGEEEEEKAGRRRRKINDAAREKHKKHKKIEKTRNLSTGSLRSGLSLARRQDKVIL